MRRDEPDIEHPGFLVARRHVGQPRLGPVGDQAVVPVVAGLARSDPVQHLRRARRRQRIADRAPDLADAVHDVHGLDPPVETGIDIVVAIVELADGLDAVPFALQAVTPARDSPVIGMGVVPVPRLVDIAPGREGGACRDADRRIGVGGGEPRAALGQPVEIGRPHHVVAAAAEHLGVVLVRHDEEEVLAFIHGAGSLCFPVLRGRGRKRRRRRPPAP